MQKIDPLLLKFISAAILLMTWGTFAFLGKTSVEGFITAINSALLGLGVYHVLKPADATTAPPAPAAAPADPATPT